MNLKFSCPYCGHSFSTKPSKPGKYKPKCTRCGQVFLLTVSDSDPPTARTNKIETSPTRERSPTGTKVDNNATLELTAMANSSPLAAQPSERTSTGSLDATLAPEQVTAPSLSMRSSAVEVTMDSIPAVDSVVSKTNSGFDQTKDSSEVSSNSSIASKASQKDFSFDGATLDSEMSSPAPGVSSSRKESQALSQRSQPSGSGSKIARLGGYQIIKELGVGGMGSVYLARQLSLDRPCALKTIQAQWASNPRVIARFIREAYAAAQLTHHNVVQIYDLGQDGGTNFFSMELVQGGSLEDQLKNKGKLAPKLAATLILQAARGLKFAHDHGMVHRDIKPANLMLTSDGFLKIADLGLVKTQSADESITENDADTQKLMLASARSQVTMQGASMGTPAYMAPEQAMDATNVDKRADIYSLGCTFYALLTGKPPFEGKTVLEVLSKHKMEKIVRPEMVVTGLPKALGDIIEKMTEKKIEDRYQDMDELINDLEVFLELREDISGASIRYEHRDRDEVHEQVQATQSKRTEERKKPVALIPDDLGGQIEIASSRFRKSPLIFLRTWAPRIWFGLCALLILISVGRLLGMGFSLIAQGAQSLIRSGGEEASQGMGGAMASLVFHAKAIVGYAIAALLAPIIVVVIGGYYGVSPLASRYRQALFASHIGQKIFWGFAGLLGLGVVSLFGLWITVVLAFVVGSLAAAAYYFGIEKPLSSQRKGALEQALGAVRQLRLRGADEQSIRQAFVQKAGSDWQEIFEFVFGYSEMRLMRDRMIQAGEFRGRVFRPYRDRLMDRCDKDLQELRRTQDAKVIARAEQAELQAKGVSESEARVQAEAVAASLIDAARETRLSMHEIALGRLTEAAAEAKRERIKKMLAEARAGKVTPQERRSRRLDFLLGHFLGSKMRFVAASILLIGVGMWVRENQQPLESYWRQTRSSVEQLSNAVTKGELGKRDDSSGAKAGESGSGIPGSAIGGISAVSEEVFNSLGDTSKFSWNSVLGGLIHEKNVVFVGLAGLILLGATLLYGWKISFVVFPLAGACLAIPWFLW